MTSEQKKQTIVRRFVQESWKGNLDVVDELMVPNYAVHDPADRSRFAARMASSPSS